MKQATTNKLTVAKVKELWVECAPKTSAGLLESFASFKIALADYHNGKTRYRWVANERSKLRETFTAATEVARRITLLYNHLTDRGADSNPHQNLRQFEDDEGSLIISKRTAMIYCLAAHHYNPDLLDGFTPPIPGRKTNTAESSSVPIAQPTYAAKRSTITPVFPEVQSNKIPEAPRQRAPEDHDPHSTRVVLPGRLKRRLPWLLCLCLALSLAAVTFLYLNIQSTHDQEVTSYKQQITSLEKNHEQDTAEIHQLHGQIEIQTLKLHEMEREKSALLSHLLNYLVDLSQVAVSAPFLSPTYVNYSFWQGSRSHLFEIASTKDGYRINGEGQLNPLNDFEDTANSQIRMAMNDHSLQLTLADHRQKRSYFFNTTDSTARFKNEIGYTYEGNPKNNAYTLCLGNVETKKGICINIRKDYAGEVDFDSETVKQIVIKMQPLISDKGTLQEILEIISLIEYRQP